MEHGKWLNSKKVQCLNGTQLKAIAFFSMLLDHVNNALLVPILEGKGFLLQVSNLLSILGRIAFPLFIFFLVEGFFKTRNRRKYLLHLFLFGVISEVPFDLFTSKVLFNPNGNNMMFTLTLCLSCIWIIDIFKRKIPNRILWYGFILFWEAFMPGIEEKIDLLKRIAHRFEEENVEWALGGSMMLYFKKIVPSFDDLDLMIFFSDVDRVRHILSKM